MTIIGYTPTIRNLEMTRGDGGVNIAFTHSLAPSAASDFDECRFVVRTAIDGDIVLALTLTANAAQWTFDSVSAITITLNADDTDGLLSGRHIYDIELLPNTGTYDGLVTTVQRGEFYLRGDISNDGGGGALAGLLDKQLKEWASLLPDFMLTSVTYHGTYTNAPATATINWPDGSGGTYTTTAYDTTNRDWSSFTATHTDSGKTVTQAAITRNSSGNVTTRPALTVA